MPSTIETGTMDLLLLALDSRDASKIRGAAVAVLQAAFEHQAHDVEVPGLAMSTILVVANC